MYSHRRVRMALSSSATKINGGLVEREVWLVPDMSCVSQNTKVVKLKVNPARLQEDWIAMLGLLPEFLQHF